jgi:hypothetical protein
MHPVAVAAFGVCWRSSWAFTVFSGRHGDRRFGSRGDAVPVANRGRQPLRAYSFGDILHQPVLADVGLSPSPVLAALAANIIALTRLGSLATTSVGLVLLRNLGLI